MVKEFNSNYVVSVKSKNIDVTDAIEKYVYEKLAKIDRFASFIIDITVTLEVQKLSHKVSILMKFLHFKIYAEAVTDDLYSAIDKSSEKINLLIKKYKNKLQKHHNKHMQFASSTDMIVNIIKEIEKPTYEDEINDLIEEENLKQVQKEIASHVVVAKDKVSLKTLNQDEAVMKIELSGEGFLLYKSEESQKISLMYKIEESSGGFGIIEIINNG